MKTIKINVYEFSELDDKVQAQLIEQEKMDLLEFLEMDLFKDYAHEKIKEAGFGSDADALEYNLSYSQGDGVAFYGTVYEDETAVLFDEFLQEKNISITEKFSQFIKDNTYFRITRNHRGYRYSHWNTMNVEIENDYFLDEIEEFTEFETVEEGHEKVDSLLNDFSVFLTKKVQDLSHELETLGYEYIEEQTSDEVALQNLKYNYYTAEGVLV